MNGDASLLPKEVAALVHHIELNRAGWWEKVIQRLALAAVWWSDHPPSVDEIRQTIAQEFKLSLTLDKLCSVLSALEKQNLLVALDESKFRIPDAQRRVFEQDIAAAEKVELVARELFCRLATDLCPTLDATSIWTAFQSELLTPLIKEVGANAYHLISGDRLQVGQHLVDRFLKSFQRASHSSLRELVTRFLDPQNEEVRAHVSRMLHARFCVEAGGLPADVIEKLDTIVGKQAQFRVFVDTNFLFSLLELHENPSNAAARELLDLISQLKTNPRVKLFILPKTIEEAKSAIAATKQRVTGIPGSSNFTQAALGAGISGMAETFLLERMRRDGKLTAEDWFDPYLNDFVAISRERGVEVFNVDLAAYSQRQDVVDDILYVVEFEKRYDEGKRKSYPKIAHDMILWHFVKDQRPAYIESPIDARDWILTIDFRLIGFDQYRQRQSGLKIPLCLHPTSLIQLLRFWVPRTKEFEEAMLGSLRLPFLFQEFDVEAERTSIRILKGLGRFEGRDDISAETITSVVLNDGLRMRIRSEQAEDGEVEIALIRDALLEEMKVRAASAADAAQRLATVVREKETDLRERDARERSKDAALEKLRVSAAEQELRANAAAEALTATRAEVDKLKAEVEGEREGKKRRSALLGYFGLLAVLMLVSGITAWQVDRLLPKWAALTGKLPFKAFAAILVFIAGHLLLEWFARKHGHMARLWPLRLIRTFRKQLWGLVILGFVIGVLGNLYANRIQREIDQMPLSPPESRSSPASVPPTESEGQPKLK